MMRATRIGRVSVAVVAVRRALDRFLRRVPLFKLCSNKKGASRSTEKRQLPPNTAAHTVCCEALRIQAIVANLQRVRTQTTQGRYLLATIRGIQISYLSCAVKTGSKQVR
jgi:hypothetical protein